MAGAMTAGAAATGVRAWLFARAGTWMTPRRRTLVTRILIALGVLAAGLIGPSGV
jgi:hypothetical protein